MDDKRRSADPMPSTIGRYQIQASVGAGAMGAVYKAFDPLIKRTLAIKTLRLDIPRDSPEYQSFIERFYHEARISGTLSHPNIVTLFDIGEENGLPYLAMEYVEGETIASMLERGQRFPPEKVIALVSQVGAAVDYAHGRGVIHRDVKPSNLILYGGDRIKVTDFGIAKVMGSGGTQAGVLLGTPSYMSPEQAMGEKLDGRTDIFSLGACAFEMLSGQQPFPGSNVTAILYKVVNAEPVEPANLEMHGLVPQKFHEVFLRVLAKKPDDRYQTAAEFVQDLEYCLGAWFGAAMGDQTWFGAAVEEGGAPAPAAAASESLPEEDIPETVNLTPGEGAGDIPSTIDLRPSLGEPAVVPPVMDELLEDRATVIRAPKSEPPARPAPAARPGGAGTPPAEQATVLMPSPTRARAVQEPAPAEEPPADRPPARRLAARPAPPPRPSSAAPPPLVAGRGGVPMPIAAGGAVVLLLIGAALGAWAMKGRGDKTSAEGPGDQPAVQGTGPGALRLDTQPKGATVVINGEPAGATPLNLGGLPVASYVVKLELKGYEPQTQTVVLTPEAPHAEIKVPLAPAEATSLAGMATADIASTPSGLPVKIDGATVGRTPLKDFRISTGSHRVELAADGFEPFSGTLQADAARRVTFDAPLKAIVRATPTPTAKPTPVEERVYLEDEVDTVPVKISGAPVPPAKQPKMKAGQILSVTASFIVTNTGKVEDVRIEQSSGNKRLDEAHATALRGWAYNPGVKAGKPVKVQLFRKTNYRAVG
jgi:TonB family protein